MSESTNIRYFGIPVLQSLAGSKKNILELIFEEEIPALNGNIIDKVELHMDRASNHMSKSTTAYLAKKESETGINIPFCEIPVKFTW
ncbi:hypothetical protein TNCV_4327431 [Trichonephila clavipes]|nr:hypothetical protein TNCV_4327431 [Trichonephila clavipes]